MAGEGRAQRPATLLAFGHDLLDRGLIKGTPEKLTQGESSAAGKAELDRDLPQERVTKARCERDLDAGEIVERQVEELHHLERVVGRDHRWGSIAAASIPLSIEVPGFEAVL